MNSKYYIIIIAALSVLCAFSLFLAYSYHSVFSLLPSLSEHEKEAYTSYICELQKELEYPVCSFGAKIYAYDQPVEDFVKNAIHPDSFDRVLEKTNASPADIAKALANSGGDVEEAIDLLNQAR